MLQRWWVRIWAGVGRAETIRWWLCYPIVFGQLHLRSAKFTTFTQDERCLFLQRRRMCVFLDDAGLQKALRLGCWRRSKVYNKISSFVVGNGRRFTTNLAVLLLVLNCGRELYTIIQVLYILGRIYFFCIIFRAAELRDLNSLILRTEPPDALDAPSPPRRGPPPQDLSYLILQSLGNGHLQRVDVATMTRAL